jgi:tagaturonate reductase
MDVPYLNKRLIEENKIDKNLISYQKDLLNLPIKIIQFGEGNFIRAFFDYFIHKLNCNNMFNGRIAVIKPREGSLNKLRMQDCLFTLITAGIEKGKKIYEKEIISSIGKAIDTYSSWQDILDLVKDVNIKVIVTNTTERGISFNTSDKYDDKPPSTFPAKLTRLLYERYKRANRSDGFIILPLELIENNGTVLKDIVLKYIDLWGLESRFKNWVSTSNLFVNTLVDRIVPGYPSKRAEKIFKEIGYRDNFLTLTEIYHLFAIEETRVVKKVLPFHKAGINVVFSSDISKYRELKLRILNGVHTGLAAIALLENVQYVKNIFVNEKLNKCLNNMIFNEIVPTLSYDKELVLNFAKDVIERFKNPYIEHKWSDIFLNSITKFQIRLFPTINKHYALYNSFPPLITFSYSLLMYLFKDARWIDDKLIYFYNNKEIQITDEASILNDLYNLWQAYNKREISINDLLNRILVNPRLCSIDNTYIMPFKEIVAKNLNILLQKGFDLNGLII